jgi:hypothetical protein
MFDPMPFRPDLMSRGHCSTAALRKRREIHTSASCIADGRCRSKQSQSGVLNPSSISTAPKTALGGCRSRHWRHMSSSPVIAKGEAAIQKLVKRDFIQVK